MLTAFKVVMDPETNPLSDLPKVQRFQIMTYLGLMWSAIFSFGIGYWAIFGQLVILHVLAAFGAAFTGITFSSAPSLTHRDLLRRSDGTSRYDDVWGAP